MSPISIVISIVVVIVVITIVAYVKHSLDNARLEKARLLSEFNSRVRRADYLLNDIPLQMLSNGLAVFLLEEKQHALECIKDLCGRKVDPDVLNSMEQVKQRLSVIQQEVANKQQEAFAITSEKRAKEIKSLLHELYRQVSDSYKNSRLNKADANKFSLHIKGLLVNTSIELLSYFGREAEKQKKYRSAINYYTQAVDELKKRNQNQQYTEQIKPLQSLIRTLEQKESEKAGKTETSSGQLIDQIDELKGKDDDWKKKNVYD
ncbi:hypothetical protein [Spartinivicinus ruber]|uniref:hypothetical protein n=1 Tax=Spartinivicinus ruber TaxID=2683272 RepID=UPI0013D716D9|nr:hypothetical protein [Spartinivicinus ruber]